ncbi:MAG: hypothetical protein P4M02_04220, partial [Clostridia bacterium]|nr:hypothetical protein [Clostridia bacterium]
ETSPFFAPFFRASEKSGEPSRLERQKYIPLLTILYRADYPIGIAKSQINEPSNTPYCVQRNYYFWQLLRNGDFCITIRLE